MSKAVLTITFAIVISGCAGSYPYKEDKSNEYRKHWENNDKVKDNVFLYPLSVECEEDMKQGKTCL